MSAVIDYPNPVLSPERDDYIEGCTFDISFEESNIVVNDEFIQIPATCELVSVNLSELIKQEKASIVVLINSSSFYRKSFVFDNGEKEKLIEIPKFHVKNRIEFCGFIVANESIDNFNGQGEFNDLYFKNISFAVKKADVLAKGRTRVIPIDDSELEKPISSIFTIIRNPEATTDVETDFDTSENEKIIIKLSDKLNQLYYKMKDFNNGSLRRYLNGIIVYPVLVEAIAKICDYYREQGTDYSDKRWFRVIERKLSNLNINLEVDYDAHSYVELADKLLGSIAFDGLTSVDSTINDEVNTGEYINTGGND